MSNSCQIQCPIIPVLLAENEDMIQCLNCGADYFLDDLDMLPKCMHEHRVCEMCIDDICFEPFKVGLSKAENPEAEIGKLEIIKRDHSK